MRRVRLDVAGDFNVTYWDQSWPTKIRLPSSPTPEARRSLNTDSVQCARRLEYGTSTDRGKSRLFASGCRAFASGGTSIRSFSPGAGGGLETNRLPAFHGSSNAGLFSIVAVTALKDHQREFHDVVVRDLLMREMVFLSRNTIRTCWARSRPCSICKPNSRPLAVLINTPNCFHSVYAKTALHHGCHVYAERPVRRHSDKLEVVNLVGSCNRARDLQRSPATLLKRRLATCFTSFAIKSGSDELQSIRCVLASGREIEGWRATRTWLAEAL